MTFEFLFGLSLAIETLAVTDLLATQLQAKDLSAQSGKEMDHIAIKTLVGLKSEFARFCIFYNNERSHDFDEDILRTQLQIFSKNFPFKEQLLLLILKITSKRWNQAQGNCCQKLENF